MSRQYTNRRYLDALKVHVLIFDGAMGTNLQTQSLTAENFGGEQYEGCNDHLVLTCPRAVEKVHRSFLEVGVDVIETCTFRANRLTLGEYHLGSKVKDINDAAARLARHLADEYSTPGHPRFVAGSIGPSGKLPSMNDPELSSITVEELILLFQEQAAALIQGGVDLLLIETSQDILEVKCAIQGVHKAFMETGTFLPVQAQVTFDQSGRMLMGTDASAVLAILDGLPIDVIGLNCSTGPQHMREPVSYFCRHSALPVSCIPNAGLPVNIEGNAVYPLTVQEYANDLTEFACDLGVNVVGGCCGTTPDHLKLLVEKIHYMPPKKREVMCIPSLSSAVQAQPLRQEPRPFLIGERLNTQGSAKFKQLILERNFDAAMSIARQQANCGAHGIDICTVLTERQDEAESMKQVIKTLGPVVRIPFIIDSTDTGVIEQALCHAPGRCLINSANMEDLEKTRRIFSLAKDHNAAVIILTIDEKGMAKTCQEKVATARRAVDLAVGEFELRSSDLVIDALTFTLGTGQEEHAHSAVETLEAIEEIKQAIPGVLTSLGISNVSYGLDPAMRPILNSVFLYHAVQAGLDMAIVNPAQIIPFSDIDQNVKELVEDIVLDRKRKSLQSFLRFWKSSQVENEPSFRMPAGEIRPDEKLRRHILHRTQEGLNETINQIFQASTGSTRQETALRILNTILLPAMQEVGEKFGSGETILPFVLQSAEVMKSAVSLIEPYLSQGQEKSKGTVILATVYGDVHDIGKNLAKTILSNNGYSIVDLGKGVPAHLIISKVRELKPLALGLSALLVSTSQQMRVIIQELIRQEIHVPVLLGGAAINENFVASISTYDHGKKYPAYYCKDAFSGLSLLNTLMADGAQQPAVKSNKTAAQKNSNAAQQEPKKTSSQLVFIHNPPQPPFWGKRKIDAIPLVDIQKYLDKRALYRLSWGAKNASGDKWVELQGKFDRQYDAMIQKLSEDPWIQPKAVYGYWRAQSRGEDLLVYDPDRDRQSRVVLKLHFPRQKSHDQLCVADYFASVESGVMDTIAFQVVTVGQAAVEKVERFHKDDHYSESYFHHGLAVQMTESAAEYVEQLIRHELGIEADPGKRYSWGYPGLPDLSEHQKIFDLLDVPALLGLSLTSAFQIVPEFSTAALFVHHPQARYFSTE